MSSKFFGNKHDQNANKNQGKLKGKGRSKTAKNVSVKKSGRGK